MKKSDLLTIEKLKLIMDSDNLRRETNVTTECLRKITRQQTEKPKATVSHHILSFLGHVLGPFLPSDNTNSDGRIASIVYLICLTTAGIVMNLTAWLQKDTNVMGITTDHIDGFLITCICPALLWIVYIFCKQNDRKIVDFIGYYPHCHRPLMAGAYIFGAGSSVIDILHISFHLQCSHNISSLIFSIFKAVFILLQILFLRKFANATLHRSQYVRLVLFHILGTNICIWFRAVFSHARLMFKTNSSHTVYCGADDVPLSKITVASEPYLYPFTMEYCLIAGGILYTLWSELKDLDPDPQDIYIYDEMQDSSENGKLIKVGHNTSSDRTYIPRSYSQLSLYSKDSNQSTCQTCRDNPDVIDDYKPSSDPGFLLGILLSILLYISIACLWIDKNSPHALRFYYLFQISLHSAILVCLWITLMALQSQKPAWYSYNSDDALLIGSFIGVLLYSGLSLTATITEVHTFGIMTVYYLVRCILVLLESMLQVTAIVKAVRFRPSPKRIHSDIVRQCALFLLTTNIALWGRDSFFELHDLVTIPVQSKLFGETTWRVLTLFAYPLCIFFRFHAAACLYEVWSTFKTTHS